MRNIIQWKQTKVKKIWASTATFNHQTSCNRTINLCVIDNYFKYSIIYVFWLHIRNWDHVCYKFFFRILNVSDSLGYPFRSGSINIHNQKYHKTRSIQYLCLVRFKFIFIRSDSVRSFRFGLFAQPYITHI